MSAPARIAGERLSERRADRYADILDGMVGVDVQIALGRDIEVYQSMSGDLVEHMIEKRHARVDRCVAGAIEPNAHGNLRFQGIASDFGFTHVDHRSLRCFSSVHLKMPRSLPAVPP